MDDQVKAVQERLRKTLSQVMSPVESFAGVPIISFEVIAEMPTGGEDLVYRVTAELKGRGWRVANLRRFGCNNVPANLQDVATPYVQAQTDGALMATPGGMVLVKPSTGEPSLEEMLDALGSDYDVYLAESFGYLALPKILVTRKVQEGFNLGLPNIVGYASDSDAHALIPRFDTADAAALADFIERRVILPSRGEEAAPQAASC